MPSFSTKPARLISPPTDKQPGAATGAAAHAAPTFVASVMLCGHFYAIATDDIPAAVDYLGQLADEHPFTRDAVAVLSWKLGQQEGRRVKEHRQRLLRAERARRRGAWGWIFGLGLLCLGVVVGLLLYGLRRTMRRR
jgi:hypothetical protein